MGTAKPRMRPQRARGARAGASRGASPSGRAHPGWNRPWALPVPPTRAGTPAFPTDRAPVPGDPSCRGYGITAAVSIGTATGNREIHGDDGEERAAGAGGEGHRGSTAAGAQTVPPAPHGSHSSPPSWCWSALGVPGLLHGPSTSVSIHERTGEGANRAGGVQSSGVCEGTPRCVRKLGACRLGWWGG